MRQVGVIAAAARVALAGRQRLVEDHLLARKLAVGLAERFPDSVDLDTVETNMVRVGMDELGMSYPEVKGRLDSVGIKVGLARAGTLRLVTHRDVDERDVDRLLGALQ